MVTPKIIGEGVKSILIELDSMSDNITLNQRQDYVSINIKDINRIIKILTLMRDNYDKL